ncbi:MAG: acetate kinase [Deltaproteobacteria bacterium]|nr:acetate kinase [Deltaproteobacteria bacterium]
MVRRAQRDTHKQIRHKTSGQLDVGRTSGVQGKREQPKGEVKHALASDAYLTAQGKAELPSNATMGRGGPSSIVAVRQREVARVTGRKALVLNSGSSSIKFQVRQEGGKTLISGKVERIGEDESKLTLKVGGTSFEIARPIKNHEEGLRLLVEALTDPSRGAMKLEDISAVGHRVVHGGPRFKEPVRIDADVEQAIADYAKLAPLHNPPALAGISAVHKVLGDLPQIAVFDTAFHATLPEEASSYALPKEWREEGVRRYGFHGISVENATARAAKMLGRPLEATNLIVCHLGNGASITAVEHGKSRDTSMGMTPLAGITMGTRPGDVDVGVIFHLLKQGHTIEQIEKDLNNRSGLLGLSDGLSNDVRELLAAEATGDPHAKLALEKYTEDITEQIGAFLAKLRGDVHAIVFTGGVGENSGVLRERIVSHLNAFGFSLDKKKNGGEGSLGVDEANISPGRAAKKVLVIRADEEGAIGEAAFKLTRE